MSRELLQGVVAAPEVSVGESDVDVAVARPTQRHGIIRSVQAALSPGWPGRAEICLDGTSWRARLSAARIANTGRSTAGKRGGKSPSYEEWSKKDLQGRAKELGIEGRSKMNKGELIDALRNH